MSSLSYAEQLRNDLFRAYEDARKNKRNTIAQLEFKKDAEHNLIELYHELLDGSYVPGKSICFLTHFPVLREVFASQFRDRVVHHLLFNYIAPIFEKTFIYDSYSCRKEKGTLFGVERLEHHIRSCTNNYTHTAYILKLDIQGIPKEPDTRDKNISEGKVRIDTSSQEDILATLYPWRCISGCFRQAIQKICHTKKRKQLQEQSQENHLVLNKRRVDHRTVGGNPSLTQLLSRLSWTLQEL